jgi:hypothetical protein
MRDKTKNDPGAAELRALAKMVKTLGTLNHSAQMRVVDYLDASDPIELDALVKLKKTVGGLSAQQRSRVLAYIRDHFDSSGEQTSAER